MYLYTTIILCESFSCFSLKTKFEVGKLFDWVIAYLDIDDKCFDYLVVSNQKSKAE